MRNLAVIAALATVFPAAAFSQDDWLQPSDMSSAIAAAESLYANEPAHDPYRAVVLDMHASELAAMYALLEERLPPMRIYSFSNAPVSETDFANLPSAFAPGSAEDLIITFILKHEAGKRGYNAVWYGNRYPLPRLPTEMTICEIREWQIAAVKGQASSAIGLFQIVGPTFRTVTAKMGLPCGTRFDAKTQDRIGLALLHGRGWAEFKSGTMSIEDFGFELAGEWAAFPAPYGENKGRSRYENIAGNKHQIELPAYLEFLGDLRKMITSGNVISSEDWRLSDVSSQALENRRSDPSTQVVGRADGSAGSLRAPENDRAGRLQILTFAAD